MIKMTTISRFINEPTPKVTSPSNHSITSMTTTATNQSISNYPHLIGDNMVNKLDVYMARHFKKMYFLLHYA